MPKNIPSLKPRELLRMLVACGCSFHKHRKGHHDIYSRIVEGRKRIVPIDMGAGESVTKLYDEIKKVKSNPISHIL